MEYLKLVETLPTTLEEGKSDNKIAVKKAKVVPEGYVDLGLPSGLLWAECNVGAKKPEEYGKYFQWGDVEGGLVEGETTTRTYNWTTAPFNNGASSYDKTYFTTVKDTVCPNGVLAAEYDAASVATNGVAHMPTNADFEELTANTTSAWTQVNNVNGIKFTASNGNSIFIPASGFANYGSVYRRGANGYVWSSSLYSSDPINAWLLSFCRSSVGVGGYGRCNGRSVRGVVSK